MRTPDLLPCLGVMLMLLWRTVLAGLGGPTDPAALLKALYGNPCDCGGGDVSTKPSIHFHQVDCGAKTAYLKATKNQGTGGLGSQSWQCMKKPQYHPSGSACPAGCTYVDQMHAQCYASYSECKQGDRVFFVATATKKMSGRVTGDWSIQPQVVGSTKILQASCNVDVGKMACWPKNAPVHVSDGGGPTDLVREARVHEEIQRLIDALIPQIHYHPLLFPKPKGIDIDPQTFDIIEATHSALNISNPQLAQDCWLCLAFGNSWPLALPSYFNGTFQSSTKNCSFIAPFKVQPVALNVTVCVYKHYQNNTFDIDVGHLSFTFCESIINVSSMLCSPSGHVFVCGGNMAYTFLPTNWAGLCSLATLLPDVELISGDEPVPIPTFDYVSPRHKRAVQFIPLLVGMGVVGALGTRTAGLAAAVSSYTKLSQQLADDITMVYKSVQDLQDQIDSLAEVVLQNRRGLDLLTADKGGICLTLQERCCFYANKSGVVRDRIKQHQEELIKRR